MKQRVFWTALEYTCRLLGVSTAAVLLGVGTETLLQGQFQSLAVYLLFTGVAVSICEVSYFISLFLAACFTCQPGSVAHGCWKQASRRRGFQKFLGYVLFSVACFLHPVLVWHVTIPGTMLVLTGLAYFLLSKQQKERVAGAPLEQYQDSCGTAVSMEDTGNTKQTYNFHKGTHKGQHASLLGHMQNILKGRKGQCAGRLPQALAEPYTDSPEAVASRTQAHFEENIVKIVLSVNERSEDLDSEAEDNTSDTAPILGPSDTVLAVTALSSTGLF
uniref:Transmembrane protein 72 n=1 Tax=Sphenodon punctatus TaxID=8508 RepID=A0A8D0L191_SPHPU